MAYAAASTLKLTTETPTTLALSDSMARPLSMGIGSLILATFLALVANSSGWNWAFVLFVLICGAAGIMLVANAKSRSTVFDKTTNSFTITARGVFGSKQETHAFSEVASVAMYARRQTSSIALTLGYVFAFVSEYHFRSGIVLTNGAIVLLDNDRAQGRVLFGKNKRLEETAMAQKIAAFIGVPFEEKPYEKGTAL